MWVDYEVLRLTKYCSVKNRAISRFMLVQFVYKRSGCCADFPKQAVTAAAEKGKSRMYVPGRTSVPKVIRGGAMLLTQTCSRCVFELLFSVSLHTAGQEQFTVEFKKTQ